jgi:hypothetical protein
MSRVDGCLQGEAGLESTPVPFSSPAMIGGPVKRATEAQAVALMRRWDEQKALRRLRKPAGKFTVPDPARYKVPQMAVE